MRVAALLASHARLPVNGGDAARDGGTARDKATAVKKGIAQVDNVFVSGLMLSGSFQ